MQNFIMVYKERIYMPNSRPEEEFHVWKLWIYLEAFLLAIKIPAYSRAAAYQTQALHTHTGIERRHRKSKRSMGHVVFFVLSFLRGGTFMYKQRKLLYHTYTVILHLNLPSLLLQLSSDVNMAHTEPDNANLWFFVGSLCSGFYLL